MFNQLKDEINLCARAGITACLWGHKGIGKSSIISQIAKEGVGEKAEDGVSLPIGLIDYRCSQLESSDLRGLPEKTEDGFTRYCPPAELPIGDLKASEIHQMLLNEPNLVKRKALELRLQPRYEYGILFLDEPNRAADDVLQAIFQLIYDRKIGSYQLPDKWSIVMACNFMQGAYQTNGFTDAAFLDRMCHLMVEVGPDTLGDWSKYLVNQHGESAVKVINFCSSNVNYLLDGVEGKLGFEVTPSPRSWDRVIAVEKIAEQIKVSDESLYKVVSGLVGISSAIAYRNHKCPIQPAELLHNGIKPYADKLTKMDRGNLVGVIWGFCALVQRKLNDKNAMKIAVDLVEVLMEHDVRDKDLIVSFCRNMISAGSDDNQLTALITNCDVAKFVVDDWIETDAEDKNLFIIELVSRTKLHKELSKTGWGS